MDFLMQLGLDPSTADRAFMNGLQDEARRIVSTAARRQAVPMPSEPTGQQTMHHSDGEPSVLAMSAGGGQWRSGRASGVSAGGPRLGWRR